MHHGAGSEDYFRLSTPASALDAILCKNGITLDYPATAAGRAGEAGFVLGLQRQEPALDRIKLGNYFVPIIPFPQGTIGLASLILDPSGHLRRDETINVYLSRRTFDQIADTLGTERIVELPLAPGIATGDTVIENLFSCLIPALKQPDRTSALFIDHVGKAFNAHIAQRYGRMQMARSAVIGGLTPWQLRRARDTINARLDQDVSLAQLASDCGLSISHFARAFARSTGVPPHRWVMQRRVDRAKELMRAGMPLAEIALMCGFSDQSHLTRVFSHTVGLTPGRWRESQISAAFDMAPITVV
ncbi:AraC family transcriptional regulator [Rhizobium leucaenae]|jgi:AraC family transcriptional regulator|uniref:AraC-like DNA-binding protein n=1 Tax=Rhizobium leucaenae TaxID=29450 RepID=A0A7W6ZQ56_9HYPH|nr:AraC family transcriptional regulator [Rhizobium leucaenae]MBB4566708.1 AraC-like DNA-binding protein [Rhizobium leucaenae]MBB6301397.1 AraC-like DNA-binding protein [Rhizobium leucaenae]